MGERFAQQLLAWRGAVADGGSGLLRYSLLTRGLPALVAVKRPPATTGGRGRYEEGVLQGGPTSCNPTIADLIRSVELGSEGVGHGRRRPAGRSAQNRMRCANRRERRSRS
jgi:hypothetical protein